MCFVEVLGSIASILILFVYICWVIDNESFFGNFVPWFSPLAFADCSALQFYSFRKFVF
uniref:Uncharacterized protein n=1 Tax=Rhizophora mucronata TaxID=61149 RepID=A0A2P2INZ8_RHIMU